jgi:hypothetical protein
LDAVAGGMRCREAPGCAARLARATPLAERTLWSRAFVGGLRGEFMVCVASGVATGRAGHSFVLTQCT